MLTITGCNTPSLSNKDKSKNKKSISNATKTEEENTTNEKKTEPPDMEVFSNPESISVLVNRNFLLESDHSPIDLVIPDVTFSFGKQDIEKSYMRKEAASAIEKLFARAEADNIHLAVVSAYRSYERQNQIFNNSVKTKGLEATSIIIAPPGASEHQTGLAVDISSKSVGFDLVESFSDTIEGKWLALHAHEYGFILRYPLGKEDITGYQYEPWHFRYLGVELATTIVEKNITYEEYIANLKGV